ncbi:MULTISPECIES: macrolide hydrolase EstT [Chryseobacterium]|uniref:Pimeloyl-ACP methyl ester carboxylesterase n=1 Tax=Chryseobacterium camelliae TaxID=1265445 RepID=A0ABU0TFZ8_9FLAO|nr:MULTISPECIES: macrolide hydrolase EstT [Chryseobacterium]MDT3406214.1 pimeloyl-ACP methyl ester carboxylesterase [Pseudacidovorax intermedius]MDQ1095985.1 pimeloyl-ACP methyl ester carboxylesterase [Chryseobacterium camelliae]MDQ1099922.1 pimeloyl-ACP methyl ester carboxylesterase [Chryseobacterium sp. SORGH_AS_1048]MDR6087267.1 pimeloyl-ACP methyl ester carboxylesterase [Chryseobacterium sp. SORGH_AS_0909]MDR6131641.1 pimeloyl-ACP methyl ester carboxylesterase [Chryseobacterium sp. SORGH_A
MKRFGFFVLIFILTNSCMKAQKEKIINNGNVSICTESFGNFNNPAILLIGGATVSMLYWDADFCNKLANKGYFVIRYDNRDVDKSTTYSPGSITYNIVDLADDAVNILDAYKIKKANIMGISLGGLIAQILAIKSPNRVNSLILMSTGIWGTPDPTIPEMDKEIFNFQSKAESINWNDKKEVVHYMLQNSHLMAGRKPVDYSREEKRIEHEIDRAVNYRSMFNHSLIQGGEAYYDKMDEIKMPTLIIHGTDDKIWHFKNTEKLLADIKNSQLLKLEGTGHELNYNDWDIIITTINRFISNYPA